MTDDRTRHGPLDPVDDPELADTTDRVRAVIGPDQLRPDFSRTLRAALVAEAADRITSRQAVGTPPVLALRRPRRRARRRGVVGWAAATTTAAAAAAVVVVALPSVLQRGAVVVQASSALTGAVSADPAGAVRLTFDRPVDRGSVERGLRMTPAAAVRTAWQGDTLTVTPVHGLAPNSAYRLSVDSRVARSAGGAPLASDLLLTFGTAPAAAHDAGPDGAVPASPATLPREATAPAAPGSEAVVTRSGALLLTGARQAGAAALVRLDGRGGAVRRLAAATDAICVSRSGSSIAYLRRTAATAAAHGGAEIVLADAAGGLQRATTVAVDTGSPLGWIDDDEVTFVSGGHLTAVDRQGHLRRLPAPQVDPAGQSLVLAPGGRYAFLGRTRSSGVVVDLAAGTQRPLNDLVTDPAFTADGAGLVWADTAGAHVRVHYGAAAGGTWTTAELPVTAGGSVGDLAVAPDGSRFVYSTTPPQGRAQLRLAGLPSGVTLADSDTGAGESPNFAPSSRFLTVLGDGAGGRRIETVQLPRPPAGDAARVAAAEAVAEAFATAQVAADHGSQTWLSTAGTSLPALPAATRLTRADVVRAQARGDGTVTVSLRLTSDARPGRPVPVQAEETVTVLDGHAASGAVPGAAGSAGALPAGTLPKVSSARLGAFAPAPAGPQVLHVVTGAVPGGSGRQVVVSVDSDLDPTSVDAAVRITRPDGTALPSSARYDAAARTVTVTVPATTAGTAALVTLTGLRDVAQTPTQASSPLEIRL